MKNKTVKVIANSIKTANKIVDNRSIVDSNKEFYLKAKSINSCSRYAKDSKLSTQDVKKYVDASLEVLSDYKDYLKDYNDIESKVYKQVRLMLTSMYVKKVDFNNKDYKRIERVFSSLVAKKLNLSTSTTHEKVTESVNQANRELIKSFFSYSDNQLDAIRVLVYKFKK